MIIFDVDSHETMHKLVNLWAECVPATFEVEALLSKEHQESIARAGQAYVIAMHSPACRASQLDLLRAQLVAPAPAMFGVPAFAQNHAVGLDALRTSLPL